MDQAGNSLITAGSLAKRRKKKKSESIPEVHSTRKSKCMSLWWWLWSYLLRQFPVKMRHRVDYIKMRHRVDYIKMRRRVDYSGGPR